MIYIIIALLCGIAVTFQAPINAALGIAVNSSLMSTFIAFLIGTVILALMLLVSGQPIPTIATLKSAPWWAYCGAITGIIYVLGLIIVVPKIGVANAVVLMIIAQLVTSVILDSMGAFGTAVRPINLYRSIGILCMVVGVILVNKF